MPDFVRADSWSTSTCGVSLDLQAVGEKLQDGPGTLSAFTGKLT
jgi:hypothetical protein